MNKNTTHLPLPVPGQRPALCVMVLGTSSGAGKSWVATALCRWYRNQGFKVAPFKAQNMSNHARVVPAPGGGWGEIGTAQYLQALAAGCAPEVRMNPLLLKPEADMRSQVVLLGQVDQALTQLPWRERGRHVWPRISKALDALRSENDVVVIEGAGSPAEINLQASDVVNMRVARHAQAHCLLVSDIDRGGAFAHLYGTWALLQEEDRTLIRGFVLNKFRGDARLLAPAPQMLEALTGVPVVATIPRLAQHGLPEEDGAQDAGAGYGAAGAPVQTTVAVVAYPRASNLDEFQPLLNVPGVRLVWARSPAQLHGADWVILPGSKATASDLRWLRAQGLDAALAAHVAQGGRLWGICGGLQMLGEALIDLHGVDGNEAGLGLLPLVTAFDVDKQLLHAEVTMPQLAPPWQALSGLALQVYEIHHGQTRPRGDMVAAGQGVHECLPGLVWQSIDGRILGSYWHGLLENANLLQALLGANAPTLDSVFDRLASGVDEWFARTAASA
ncbi:cobyric acid synthase [Comamonas endophytica]|uniref:Cobyric acid synthase n=1 Tax=Comamonas endophytica TaxID=2949090 RepID=A0ABY6GBW9_9BURK|nr:MULTISPECIES: cobyric acid synthase [unclassified Acidovorax]MCD2513971.1 cobyric acid synthase [Acidovorax sp. D4N7]UYG52037.1 cobyric acid synthase [Acidovorax sp. 5MLIR]